MKLRGLLISAILLAGLAGTLYFVERKKDKAGESSTTKTEDKLFNVKSEEIQRITLQPASGEKVRLERAGDKWKIVEPREMPADDAAVSTMLGTLSSLYASETVEEKPASLKDFGLEPPAATVEFATKSGAKHTLLLGENAPAGGSVYAKAVSQPKVVVVASYVKGDLGKSLFDLREKSVLKFDTATASRVWVQNKSGKFELAKVEDHWQLAAPVKARADQSAVNDLLRQAADAKMQTLEAEDASGQEAKFGLNAPEITFKVQDSAGLHELKLSAEKSGKRYARSATGPALFTVGSELATQLGKPYADLRNKDVFDMDTWITSGLEATTPEGRIALSKEGEKWKGNDPKKLPESSAVSDALEKLKALRATSFPPLAPASKYGLDKPVLRVQVAWGEKKKEETVEVGQAGDKAYARREGEPAVYEVSTEALKSARDAVNKLK